MAAMKHTTMLVVGLTTAALLGATGAGIGASVTSQPSLLSVEDYSALKTAINKVLDDEESACQALRPAARLECLAEVQSTANVQLAELEARYRGTVNAARKAQLVRIDAAYTMARAKCFGLAGFDRDSCIVAAHAQKAHARMQIHAENHPAPKLAQADEIEG